MECLHVLCSVCRHYPQDYEQRRQLCVNSISQVLSSCFPVLFHLLKLLLVSEVHTMDWKFSVIYILIRCQSPRVVNSFELANVFVLNLLFAQFLRFLPEGQSQNNCREISKERPRANCFILAYFITTRCSFILKSRGATLWVDTTGVSWTFQENFSLGK